MADGTTGTIIGNEVSGATLESPEWAGSGILVASSSNVVVSNNYVHDCELGIATIGYGYKDAPAVNNLIENNWVEDNVCGISPQANSIGTIISHNDVLNNDVGIGSLAFDYPWQHDTPSGTEIHYNNIVGNENYGVESSVWFWQGSGDVLAEEIDATSNWWGDVGGPGADFDEDLVFGDAVSAYVLFDPWLGQQLCDLRDEIAGLSDDDFNKEEAASDQKEALLNKIDDVCQQIEDGAYRGALNKLKHDIKKRIEKWIGPEQTTLIGMVDAEIAILEDFLR